MMNTNHKTKAFLVWSIIISVLFVFVFTITLVLTQNKFVYNTINSILGGERRYLKSGNPLDYQYFEADYASKSEVLAAANALNERICEEGITLLKNNNVLPLPKGQKITVFGRNSVEIALGGSGSNKGEVANPVSDVSAALEAAGFACNPVIRDFYKNDYTGPKQIEVSMGSILTGYPICEAPLPYPQKVTDSYSQYGDAAVVVLTRIGGEGFDLPRTMFANGQNYKDWSAATRVPVTGARSADDHYLQLDQNETDMINEACANFAKVIVVVNSASPLELGFLDDPDHYAYNERLKAALWIGHPGGNGLTALGKVLNGEVNPSGRTTDTYARNFKNDPTWHNFGNNLENDGNRYTLDGKARNAYFVEYREGIYVGYRYYETRGYTEAQAGNTDWYGENVVYPFGYGLSYTDFEWTVTAPDIEGGKLEADTEIEIEVSVLNKGDLAGKDVLQLYYTPAYNVGGVEKAHLVLGDFVKTGLLQPDESKTYTLKINARDMASYNYVKQNADGTKGGYELEAGSYGISVRRNAHEAAAEYTYTLDETVTYPETEEGNGVANLFDDVSGHITEYLSRKDNFANFSSLTGAKEAAHREVSSEFISSLTYKLEDKESDPWYSTETHTQSKHTLSYGDTELKLYDLMETEYGSELWDALLDQLTIDQLTALVSTGNYRTLLIENIGKPPTIDSDGPMGFASFMGDGGVYDTCYYACETVLGSTWNADLAKEFGVMIGNEGIIGDEKGDGRTYSGWYAPAVNIHRSQFGGRNFEYYSEDGLLSGKIATAVVLGANEKGIYTFVKHFALNEQETNRDTSGLVTWANEQAMRELYFLPFEMCVSDGKTTAMMSSFNRIGTEWAGGSYNLLTRLLRDEWGFKGMVITDFNLKGYMNVDQMLRAGGDLTLSPDKSPSSKTTATDVSVIRKAAKNILYTVARSNAMNGNSENVIWGYSQPWWVIWLIVANCGVFILGGVMWTLEILRRRKIKKQNI